MAVLDFYASFSTLRKFYKGGEFILSSYKIKDKKERYHGSILKLDHEIKSFFFLSSRVDNHCMNLFCREY